MEKHLFIFQPGIWIGYGIITLNTSTSYLQYCTKWTIERTSEAEISAIQEIELEGRKENAINHFLFSNITPETFFITLSSEPIGIVSGTGVIDSSTIAWEFRGELALEGLEIYERQNDGEYLMHAEFIASEEYRTMINGRIWKKEQI